MADTTHFQFISPEDYAAEARKFALCLLKDRKSITVDDLTYALPPPEGFDLHRMGGILQHRFFEPTGRFSRSRKDRSRGVARFRLSRMGRVTLALRG